MKRIGLTALLGALVATLVATPAHAHADQTVTDQPAAAAVGDSITGGGYPAMDGIPGISRPGQALSFDNRLWPSMLHTFPADLDTLVGQGVNTVVVEIGVNDLSSNLPDRNLFRSYRLLRADGAARGVHVVLSTIVPFGVGRPGVTSTMLAQRKRVNHWIRRHGPFVDFAKALGGAVQNPAYDSGDHLHPNALGQQRLAAALAWWLRVAVLLRPGCDFLQDPATC